MRRPTWCSSKRPSRCRSIRRDVPVAGVDPLILAAISLGAVFMGAMTYIGNGPNFMVRAIAEKSGVKMPSFFGYMVYSFSILLPILALTVWLFLDVKSATASRLLTIRPALHTPKYCAELIAACLSLSQCGAGSKRPVNVIFPGEYHVFLTLSIVIRTPFACTALVEVKQIVRLASMRPWLLTSAHLV